MNRLVVGKVKTGIGKHTYNRSQFRFVFLSWPKSSGYCVEEQFFLVLGTPWMLVQSVCLFRSPSRPTSFPPKSPADMKPTSPAPLPAQTTTTSSSSTGSLEPLGLGPSKHQPKLDDDIRRPSMEGRAFSNNFLLLNGKFREMDKTTWQFVVHQNYGTPYVLYCSIMSSTC